MTCEMPQAYWEKQRKARKNHKCCECGRTIRPGDLYVEHKGIWDSSFDVFRTCLWCHHIRRMAIEKYNGYGEVGPAFGYLFEWLGEFQ